VSAVEEIQAAIGKLTEYKARGYSIDNGWLIEIDDTITYPDDPRCPLTDDDYMVALHRTIDAQIALLTHTIEIHDKYVAAGLEARWENAVREAGDLDLARAISGPRA